MKLNDEFENLVCPDCGNTKQDTFDIVADFGDEICEIRFGCTKCYEWFIMSYDELVPSPECSCSDDA